MFRGEVLPNNSFVDFDEIMYTEFSPAPFSDLPSNRNPRSIEALTCITDLVDCCGSESGTVRTVRGDWYFPDGSRVGFGGRHLAFQANRGPNEEINGQIVYGSVRLYRRFHPGQRGRFRCELPSAADPSVNQTLYANICELIICVYINCTCSHCFPQWILGSILTLTQ